MEVSRRGWKVVGSRRDCYMVRWNLLDGKGAVGGIEPDSMREDSRMLHAVLDLRRGMERWGDRREACFATKRRGMGQLHNRMIPLPCADSSTAIGLAN